MRTAKSNHAKAASNNLWGPSGPSTRSWKCHKCGFVVVIQPTRPLRLCPNCGAPITLGEESAEETGRPGAGRNELAENLLRALNEEIEHIRKEGGTRSYTIKNGERIGQAAGKLIYRFDFEGERIETDVPVRLQIGDIKELEAEIVSIVGQEITLATKSPLPDTIPKARMFAEPLFILEKLRDRISSPQENFNSSLAKKLFGEESPKLGRMNLNIGGDLNEFQKSAVERCANSEVFFIWGPPGTGKTTTIASLITHLFATGKTVLITSNTNVAVDNAIAGAERSIRMGGGYKTGDIVRVGTPQAEVPKSVLVEEIAKEKQTGINEEIGHLENTNSDLSNSLRTFQEQIALIDEYDRLRMQNSKQQAGLREANANVDTVNGQIQELQQEFEKAKKTSGIVRALKGLDLDAIALELDQARKRRAALRRKLASAWGDHQSVQSRLDMVREKVRKIDGSKAALAQRSKDILGKLRKNSDRIADLQKVKNSIEKEIVANAKVIGTTLAKTWLREEILRRRFDLVVIDEASMATLPMLYFVAGLANERILVAGDFKQIPSIVLAKTENTKRWMRRNIFEVAGIRGLEASTELCEMLRLQYRMNPDISKIVSTHIYNGLLQDHVTATRGPNVDKPPGAGYSLIVLDTSNLDPWCLSLEQSHSRENLIHAELALYMAKNAIKNGFTKIGIITPYRAQARILAKRVQDEQLRKNVEVATVHRFQGREKEVVIFDISDGRPHDASRLISTSHDEDNQSEKLLNVAISRSQDKLILIANLSYLHEHLQKDELLSKIISDCKRDGIYLLGEQFLTFPAASIDKKRSEAEDGIPNYKAADFYVEFESDLMNAKQDIAIVSAFVTARRVKKLGDTFRNAIEKGVAIRILTKPPETQFDDEETKQSAIEGVQILKDLGARLEFNQETHEKLAVIDNAIVWHGSLNILSQNKSSESMMRFVGEKTARQLLTDVGLRVENVLRPESFSELRPDMRGVTVTGRVIQVEPIQFRRTREGPAYRFAHATLEADGRQCKLTLWGAQTDLVKEGGTIRLINGYTNEYNGVVTLQSGKYGKIEVLETREGAERRFPSVEPVGHVSKEAAARACTPIADLRDGMIGVTVEGTVVKVEPSRAVSENKRVAHALLEDESDAIKLVLWEKQIDEVAQGSRIRIYGAYVKTWINERQLHAGRTGIIVPVERTEGHELLGQLENGLRKFIVEKLETHDKNYWTNKIPQDVREQAERRITEERNKRPYEANQHLNKVYYVDFPDLIKIIRKKDNWRDLFQAYFGNEESISTKLRELEPIRNAVAHNRRLEPEQLLKLRLYTKELLHVTSNKTQAESREPSDTADDLTSSPQGVEGKRGSLKATGFRILDDRKVPVIRQNRLKMTPWARLDVNGHVVEWELDEASRGWYTGFVWIDGERYTKGDAWRRYMQAES